MPPRFDEVARLKELEKKATPAKWYKAEEDEGDCDEINGTMQGWETGVLVYDRELGVFHPTKEKWRVSESEYEEVDNPLTVCSPEQESDANLIANLRNATPWLLEAAACFQPGDADLLDELIEYIDFLIPSGMEAVEEGDEEFEMLLDDQKLLIRAKDHLFRMLAAAKIMEEKE